MCEVDESNTPMCVCQDPTTCPAAEGEFEHVSVIKKQSAGRLFKLRVETQTLISIHLWQVPADNIGQLIYGFQFKAEALISVLRAQN